MKTSKFKTEYETKRVCFRIGLFGSATRTKKMLINNCTCIKTTATQTEKDEQKKKIAKTVANEQKKKSTSPLQIPQSSMSAPCKARHSDARFHIICPFFSSTN